MKNSQLVKGVLEITSIAHCLQSPAGNKEAKHIQHCVYLVFLACYIHSLVKSYALLYPLSSFSRNLSHSSPCWLSTNIERFVFYSPVLVFSLDIQMFRLDPPPLFIVTRFVHVTTRSYGCLVGLSTAARRHQTALSLFCRLYRGCQWTCLNPDRGSQNVRLLWQALFFHLAVNIRLSSYPFVKFLMSRLNVCPAYSLT